MAGQRFDRERFAYELAQELGVDYAKVPKRREPDEAVRQVQEGIQSTMEFGPDGRGIRAGREPDDVDVLSGGASGLSVVNRARATPVRSALDPSPTFEAERDAQDVLDDFDEEEPDEIEYD